MTALTYGSIFSGVGGFDMGFDRAGFSCAFQIEYDKHCQQILKRDWPLVPKYLDVQNVDGFHLPYVDVVIFGSPCQDLSTAGKRAGLEGDRSSMFYEATRIIREISHASGGKYPKIVVWENVPGALTSNQGKDFEAVIEEMGELGADLIEWAVLDAQHFGVSQRRRRVFLIAVRDPSLIGKCPDPLLPVEDGRRGDYQKGAKKEPEPSPETRSGTPQNNFDGLPVKIKKPSSDQDYETWEHRDLAPTIVAWEATRPSIVAYGVSEDSAQNRLSVDELDTVYTINATRASVMSQHAQVFISTPLVYSFDSEWGPNTHVQTNISPTLKSTAMSPAIQEEEVIRRLTPLECERLMGWPDDHTRFRVDGKEQSTNQRMRQIGNGVATPVAKWIAERIKEVFVDE